MTIKKLYRCGKCNSQAALEKEAAAPQCCGQTMAPIPDSVPDSVSDLVSDKLSRPDPEPLDKCTLSATAEHSRPGDPQEPCDDGRAG